MSFFYMTGFFEYYLKDNICARGGGGNVTPFTLPRPLFYSHAHKGFSMIFVHLSIETSGFFIDRSRIGLLGSKRVEAFVGVALALWA